MAVKPTLPGNKAPANKGELGSVHVSGGPFSQPYQTMPSGVPGMSSLHDDIGEKSGFQADTSGYIVKKGTPFGEAAKFNYMPPGMNIADQEMSDQRDMPLKFVTAMGYPGGGWEPTPRDIKE